MTDPLKQIRDQIDAFDARLVELLNARARLAQSIGHLKQGSAYRPEREAQVLERVRALNKGPLSAEALGRLYVEIMSACRALETELTVAYLGPPGTFSEEAVGKALRRGRDRRALRLDRRDLSKRRIRRLRVRRRAGRELHRRGGRPHERSPVSAPAANLRRGLCYH
jgi:chorismate mutase/prephenate dehydratase